MATTLDPDAVRRRVDAARDAFHQGQPHRAAQRYASLRKRLATGYRDQPQLGFDYARVLFGLAASTFEVSGELDGSMALLEEAERVATTHQATGLAASIRGQRGVLLLRAGRTRQALSALDAAADLMESATPYDQMMILLNRGTLNMELGALRRATEDFDRCIGIAAANGHRELELRARHNLGYAEFLAGRIPRALAAMDQAEALTDGPPHPIGLLDRARVLREAGLAADAERLLGRAVALFAAGRLHQDVGETQLVRAECALVEGEAEQARRFARVAERIFARRGNLRWQRKAELLVLQCDRMVLAQRPERARPAALRQLASRALELARDCRAERRTDLARPAELLARECLLRGGSAVDAEAPPAMRAADPLQSRLLTREVRALAALHRGDLPRAATEVRRGLGELGSYQNGFGSLDLRTASAVHGLPLARLGLEVAERTGSPAELFAAVERGRAISIRLSSVGPPTDERTADLLATLRQVEEEARGLEGDPASGEQLGRLRGRVASLQRDIRARAWELEGCPGGAQDPGVRRSARVSEIRAAAQVGGNGVRDLRRPPRSLGGGGRVRSSGGAVRPGRRPRGRRARAAGPRGPRRARDAVPPRPPARRRTALARRRTGPPRRPPGRTRRRDGPAGRGLVQRLAGPPAVEPAAVAARPGGRRDAECDRVAAGRPRGPSYEPAGGVRRRSGTAPRGGRGPPGARHLARRPAAHR